MQDYLYGNSNILHSFIFKKQFILVKVMVDFGAYSGNTQHMTIPSPIQEWQYLLSSQNVSCILWKELEQRTNLS